MKMSESIKELAGALIAVQAELPTFLKDKTAGGGEKVFTYSYVGLDTVMPQALAILGKHDIALTQTVGTGEAGGSNLTTTFLHISGEWLTDTQPLLLVREDPKAQGSAITYARRYGLMAAIGMVAEEDDDGQAASKPRRKAATRPAQKSPAPKKAANAGQANPNQISIIMRILKDKCGDDEQAQCEMVKQINPQAVNEMGTALVFGPLTQDEAGNLIVELQKKRQEPATA